MRRLGACALVLGGIVVLFARCGGSSSETPWPVEPDNREPGPAGEARRHDDEIDTRKLPDRYTKKDAGAGGESSEEPGEEPAEGEPEPEEPE